MGRWSGQSGWVVGKAGCWWNWWSVTEEWRSIELSDNEKGNGLIYILFAGKDNRFVYIFFLKDYVYCLFIKQISFILFCLNCIPWTINKAQFIKQMPPIYCMVTEKINSKSFISWIIYTAEFAGTCTRIYYLWDRTWQHWNRHPLIGFKHYTAVWYEEIILVEYFLYPYAAFVCESFFNLFLIEFPGNKMCIPQCWK